MLATQTGSDECSPEYRVQPGDACVPVVEDIDCPELRADGIEDIRVVGDDVYGLDHGGEKGLACETEAPRTATPTGDAAADIAPILGPLLFLVLVAGTAWAARQVSALYRDSSPGAERRGHRLAIYLAAATILPAALVGALTMALLGID